MAFVIATIFFFNRVLPIQLIDLLQKSLTPHPQPLPASGEGRQSVALAGWGLIFDLCKRSNDCNTSLGKVKTRFIASLQMVYSRILFSNCYYFHRILGNSVATIANLFCKNTAVYYLVSRHENFIQVNQIKMGIIMHTIQAQKIYTRTW